MNSLNKGINEIIGKECSNISELIAAINNYTFGHEDNVGKIDESGIDLLSKIIDEKIAQLKDNNELWKEQVKIIVNNPKFKELDSKLQKSWTIPAVPSKDTLIERLIDTEKVYGDSLDRQIVQNLLHAGGHDILLVRSIEELKQYFEIYNKDLAPLYNNFFKWKYVECLLFALKKQGVAEFLSGMRQYNSLFSFKGNSSKNSAFYTDNIEMVVKLIKAGNTGKDVIKAFYPEKDAVRLVINNHDKAISEFCKTTGKKMIVSNSEAEIINLFANIDGKIDNEYRLLIPVSVFLAVNYPAFALLDAKEIQTKDEEMYEYFFSRNKCNLTVSGEENSKDEDSKDSKAKKGLLPSNSLLKCLLNKTNFELNEYAKHTQMVQDRITAFENGDQGEEDYIHLLNEIFPNMMSEKNTRIDAAYDEINMKLSDEINKYHPDQEPVDIKRKEKTDVNVPWYSIDDSEKNMSVENRKAVFSLMTKMMNTRRLKKNQLRERLVAVALFAFNFTEEETNNLLNRLGFSSLNANYVFDALMLSVCAVRNLVSEARVKNSSVQPYENFGSCFRMVYRNCSMTRQKFNFLGRDGNKEEYKGKYHYSMGDFFNYYLK